MRQCASQSGLRRRGDGGLGLLHVAAAPLRSSAEFGRQHQREEAELIFVRVCVPPVFVLFFVLPPNCGDLRQDAVCAGISTVISCNDVES